MSDMSHSLTFLEKKNSCSIFMVFIFLENIDLGKIK